MRMGLTLILLSCVLCVAATAQQLALTVGTATAVAGQTITGFIEVSSGSDVGTNIPVADSFADFQLVLIGRLGVIAVGLDLTYVTLFFSSRDQLGRSFSWSHK